MRFLKTKQFLILLMTFFLLGLNGIAQYKSYTLNADRDTINATLHNGQKQGKWVLHVDALRGEPGYEEEGIFVKDKKEGIWRQYNLTGDLIGVENYEFGGKDGIQQYYTYLGDLIREESWHGYNPDAPFDTIAVYGPGNDQIIDYKIVKAEQYSVKDGDWKYYEPGSGRLIKTEKYDRGRLVTPGSQVVAATVKDNTKKPDKTPQMLDWEKKNKGKKKVVRDGRTYE